jgi:hypothetical protein
MSTARRPAKKNDSIMAVVTTAIFAAAVMTKFSPQHSQGEIL